MALAFGATKGKAISKKVASYEYKNGENKLRLIGGVLPRYVYWLKGSNNKDIPVECLAFDREQEKFNNLVTDPVPASYPDKKCSWAYTINCLVMVDDVPTVLALNLKKKLFEQIMSAAEDLGDPTDYQNGWDVVFKKEKTGPLPFNVEYTLSVLRCKKRALSEAEIAIADAAQVIDEKFPRPTVEEIQATLVKISTGASEEEPPEGDAASQEAARDL